MTMDLYESDEARLAHEQQADDLERAVSEAEAAQEEPELVGVWAAGELWVMRRDAK
jgi:hypothetical protein